MELEEINHFMYTLDSKTLLSKIDEYEKTINDCNNINRILHYAILARRCDIVEELLKKGCDPNYSDEYNNYPIHMISSSSYLDIPSIFNKYCNYCDKLLIDKTDLNLSKSIKVILIKHVSSTDRNISDEDLLYLDSNIRIYEKRILNLLLDYETNINSINNKGFTALHDAIEDDNIEIAKLLLDRGIDSYIRSNRGVTAFILAAKANSIDIIKYLLRYYNGYKFYDYDSVAISKAIGIKSIDMITLLLDLGLNIDIIDDLGKTALHVAIEQENYTITKLLLERGADPNAENKDGRTPIYIACCNSKLVKLLLVYGARTIVIDKDNYTLIDTIKHALDNQYNLCISDNRLSSTSTIYTQEYLLSARLIIARIVLDAYQYPEIKNTYTYNSNIKAILDNKELNDIMIECKSELEKIKGTDIQDYTLDTFLLNNTNINVYRNNDIIELIKCMLELFPNYGHYIKKNIIDSEKRLSYIDNMLYHIKITNG
ncbi:ankyrin repeat protein [Fowlpox virus]|nr:ankyrin repeat protein [Fowlpox virus]